MTNKQILEKAIQKAIDGGLTGYWADRYKKCHELDEMELLVAGNIFEEGHSLEELIFDHEFAKALWGERDYTKMEHPDEYKEIPGSRQYMTAHDQAIWDMQGWRYHLQEMVIAQDPIKYLGDNI